MDSSLKALSTFRVGRDEKTDALVCNVFVQKPPEGF